MGKLITRPFQDFKHAKGKEGILDMHAMHQYHTNAVLIGKSLLAQYENPVLRVVGPKLLSSTSFAINF